MSDVSVAELRRVRVHSPEEVARAAARRVRRPLVGEHGKLMLIAADHPARGALGVGGDAMAMADRGSVTIGSALGATSAHTWLKQASTSSPRG